MIEKLLPPHFLLLFSSIMWGRGSGDALVASNGQIMDHNKSYGSPAGTKLIMVGKIHYFTIKIYRKGRQLSTKKKNKSLHIFLLFEDKNSNSPKSWW